MIKASGKVCITKAELVECDYTFTVETLMKQKGVPMRGYIQPKPHPDYEYRQMTDVTTGNIYIEWRKRCPTT
jgi:hypothetical protein